MAFFRESLCQVRKRKIRKSYFRKNKTFNKNRVSLFLSFSIMREVFFWLSRKNNMIEKKKDLKWYFMHFPLPFAKVFFRKFCSKSKIREFSVSRNFLPLNYEVFNCKKTFYWKRIHESHVFGQQSIQIAWFKHKLNPLTVYFNDELSRHENLTFLWTWILRWVPRSFATHASLCNTLSSNKHT